MKVILLAGGQSKRVKPVADKCFVRICGKYLIQWQIEALSSAGFDDFVIVGNGDNLENLESLKSNNSKVKITVVEQVDLNGGMKAAMDAAKGEVIGEDGVMVVSSNDVVDPTLWGMINDQASMSKEMDGFIVGYKVKEYFPGGYLEVDEAGLIHSIVEKPGAGNEPSDLVNLVVHVHRDVPALYAALEAASSSSDDVYEVALQQLFTEQKKYSVVPYDGFWQPVKYPWHLLKLNEYFLGKLERSISPDAQIADSSNINGNVVIESGVRVFDQVVINGPAYIGKDSIVGNFGMVRGSSLGERCVVGSFTEIARTLMQDEVWTHKNYVGDSIIGSNVSFGSGTVTGNLRLDEKEISVSVNEEAVNSGSNKLGLIAGDDIRVGINTSLMPGVKIGSNTQVGAHLFVAQDIPENSYVKSGTGAGLDVRENRERVERRSK
jgi:NDP-sugar pyrophosphorylase family protein